jgi:Fe-Mn family superoxide dismutase
MTNNIKELVKIVENFEKGEAFLAKLPYKKHELAPVMSEDTINYHYGKLARTYVDRFNSGEGDSYFNESGAFLHNIFFPQLMPPKSGNRPREASEKLINKKYGNFVNFKKEFAETAMKIQGSGWVYMSRNGDIKTIRNHAIRNDIALLVDWWEHAWALDYQHDKGRYLDNIWRCIDWNIVNTRLL